MTERKSVRCASHGSVAWEGHVACGACGRVFQTKSSEEEKFAPPVCVCGHRLMPAKTSTGKPLSFTAKPVCPLCYEAVMKTESKNVVEVSANVAMVDYIRKSAIDRGFVS